MQDQINEIVNKYVSMLPVDDKLLLVHSEVKASQFLLAVAKLAAIRDHLTNQKVKKDALKSVEYANAINSAPGTNAPTKQANAEASPNYLAAAEDVAIIDNQIMYIRTMSEVFLNAHLLYRSLLKNEG